MIYNTLALNLFLVACSALSVATPLSAQAELAIPVADFLNAYRESIPKIEKALFRNKHIEVELCSHNILEKPSPSIYRSKSIFLSNSDRYLLTTSIPKSSNTVIRLFRPHQFYALERSDSGRAKVTFDRSLPDDLSEALELSSWYAHPSINTNAGVGHGLLSYDELWYSAISGNIGSIDTVVETTDAGRACYRVTVPKIADWFITDATLYFEKSTYILQRVTSTKTIPDGSQTCTEAVIYFDLKPGDYDSIAMKSYKMYVENKKLGLPRHLQIEHNYSVYKNATHPPETFRLEQFGLPDVPERPRATSRRSLGFLAAGLTLGGLLLVAWRRGRRAAKTA